MPEPTATEIQTPAKRSEDPAKIEAERELQAMLRQLGLDPGTMPVSLKRHRLRDRPAK